MATTPPTRVDEDVYDLARVVGPLLSRSTAQQISHWARVGRELEASASVSQRDVADVLAGHSEYDELNVHEQAIVRAQWSERMDALRRSLNLTERFRAEGRSYVDIDEDGNVIHHSAPAVDEG